MSGVLWRIVLCSLVIAWRAEAQEVSLELSRPAPRETVSGSLALVAIEGRLARPSERPLDVMIAFDVSESVFLPSGDDVDGDGLLGRLRRRRNGDDSRRLKILTNDPGDTVFEAARERARTLLASLPETDVRAGLFTFAEKTRVRVRLGPPARALASLDALRAPSRAEATDLSRAIRLGLHLLGADRDAQRRRILLVFSDGHETRPGRRAALRAARSAARLGIEVHPVAIGADAAGAESLYAALARTTGGTYTGSRDPLSAVRPVLVNPAPQASIEIVNATTGETGRALRVHGDGRFDGFVRLRPGANRLAIVASTQGGSRQRESRLVFFEPPARSNASDRALVRTLRERALEIESAFRATPPQRALEIEIERR